MKESTIIAFGVLLLGISAVGIVLMKWQRESQTSSIREKCVNDALQNAQYQYAFGYYSFDKEGIKRGQFTEDAYNSAYRRCLQSHGLSY